MAVSDAWRQFQVEVVEPHCRLRVSLSCEAGDFELTALQFGGTAGTTVRGYSTYSSSLQVFPKHKYLQHQPTLRLPVAILGNEMPAGTNASDEAGT